MISRLIIYVMFSFLYMYESQLAIVKCHESQNKNDEFVPLDIQIGFQKGLSL